MFDIPARLLKRSLHWTTIALLLATPDLIAAHPVTAPTFGPAALFGSPLPLLASTSRGFLATWQLNTYPLLPYATVIRADGTLVIPSTRMQVRPLQLFTHRDAFMAVVAGPDNSAQLVRLSDDGSVVAVIRDLATPNATAASNGNDILIVEQGAAVTVRLLRDDGSLLTLPSNIEVGSSYDVTTAGKDFVIASGEPSGVYVQRIRNGAVLPPGKVRIATERVGDIDVASSGDEAVVIYSPLLSASTRPGIPSVYVRRTTSIKQDGSTMTHEHGQTLGGPLDIVWAGNSYFAIDVGSGLRLDRDARVIETLPPPGSGIGTYFALAARGSLVYALALGSGVFYGIPILAGDRLSAGPPVIAANPLRKQTEPAIASDGFDFLVAWTDDEAVQKRLATIRLSSRAERLDPQQTDLAVSGDLSIVSAAKSLTFGAGRYLLTASHVPSPRPLAPRVVVGSDAAWTGERFFVVSTDGIDVYGRFVSIDGIEDTPRLLGRGVTGYYSPAPRVAFDGNRFVVIWTLLSISNLDRNGEVEAVRVASDGTLLDSAPIAIATKARRASIASDGSSFAVVTDTQSGDVRLTHVDAAGTALSARNTYTVFEREIGYTDSCVTFDGAGYVVGWRYNMGYVDGVSGTGDPARSFVMMARAGLQTANPPAMMDIGSADLYSSPAMASNRVGDTIFVTSVFEGDSGVPRLHAYTDRELQPLPQPPLSPRKAKLVGSTIKWNPADSSAVAFVIERDGQVIAVLPASARSYTVRFSLSGLAIRAVNAAGASASQPID